MKLKTPFPRYSYAEAMAKYGSDKPDLRYGLEIVDVSDIAAASEFGVFKKAVEDKGVVRAINAKGAAAKFSNTAAPEARRQSAPEIYRGSRTARRAHCWVKVEGGENFVGVASKKQFSDELKTKLIEPHLGAADGDLLLFVADTEAVVCDAARARCAKFTSPARCELYKNWWEEKAEHDDTEKKKADAAKKKKEDLRARCPVRSPRPGTL